MFESLSDSKYQRVCTILVGVATLARYANSVNTYIYIYIYVYSSYG